MPVIHAHSDPYLSSSLHFVNEYGCHARLVRDQYSASTVPDRESTALVDPARMCVGGNSARPARGLAALRDAGVGGGAPGLPLLSGRRDARGRGRRSRGRLPAHRRRRLRQARLLALCAAARPDLDGIAGPRRPQRPPPPHRPRLRGADCGIDTVGGRRAPRGATRAAPQ